MPGDIQHSIMLFPTGTQWRDTTHISPASKPTRRLLFPQRTDPKKIRKIIIIGRLTNNPVYRFVRILGFFRSSRGVVIIVFRRKPIVHDASFWWFVFELPKFFRSSQRSIEKFVLLSDPVLIFFSLSKRILQYNNNNNNNNVQ